VGGFHPRPSARDCVKCPEGPHVCILYGIFGILSVLQYPVSQTERGIPVPDYEFFEVRPRDHALGSSSHRRLEAAGVYRICATSLRASWTFDQPSPNVAPNSSSFIRAKSY